MGKRFKAVIFDCDGVLVDSEPISARTLVQALGAFGLEIDVAYVHANYLGRSFESIEADYARRMGAKLPDHFLAHWQDAMFAAFRRELQPIPGIREVIASLEAPSAVVSSSKPERLALCLAVTDLARYFDGRIFSASMVARGKPAPDLFLLAAARLECEPRHVLAIEDSAPGVVAARAAGMTVWGFTGGGHLADQRDGAALLDAGAERVFDDMRRFDARYPP